MIYVGLFPEVFTYLCTYITSAQDPEVLAYQPDEHAESGMCFLLVPVSDGGTHGSGDPRGGRPHQQLHPALLCELNVCLLSHFRPSWSLSLECQGPAKRENAPIFTPHIFTVWEPTYISQCRFHRCVGLINNLYHYTGFINTEDLDLVVNCSLFITEELDMISWLILFSILIIADENRRLSVLNPSF